jgi:hypothetical protein
MASLRPQWADALDPTFRELFDVAEKQIPTKREQIFHTDNSVKNIEKDSSASGLSTLVDVAEGQPIPNEDADQGYDVTYTHIKKALRSGVSQEMWDDDQQNVISRRPRDLARAKVRTLEKFAADILNGGFTAGGVGTLFTSGDAKALFATDHPRTDGGTAQGNYDTADLAEDSLETASVAMRATVDNKGQLIFVQPKVLLVPPALEKEANILIGSILRPGTANNDTNPYQGKFQIIVWDYLSAAAGGSDSAWYLFDPETHRLQYFNRTDKGVTGPTWNDENETAYWKVSVRASVGFSDWRGIWGSKGDNS